MAEDMWAVDPDRHTASIEGRFYRALRSFLYGVHVDAHRALNLPALSRQDVLTAYHVTELPMPTPFAKADGGPQSKAAATFAALLAQPKAARRARDLADGLARSWFEQAGIEDEARRAVVVANLTGRIQAQQRAPERHTGWREYAAQITDPQVDRALNWGIGTRLRARHAPERQHAGDAGGRGDGRAAPGRQSGHARHRPDLAFRHAEPGRQKARHHRDSLCPRQRLPDRQVVLP